MTAAQPVTQNEDRFPVTSAVGAGSSVTDGCMDEEAQLFVIEPAKGWIPLRLGEVWEYRELLYFLVWRDLKIRYKQAVLGVAWAVLQPIMTMAVYTLIFGVLVRVPSEGVPYSMFVLSGIVVWMMFNRALMDASGCLIEGQGMIKKVYFPRLLLPMAGICGPLVDFAIAFIVLEVMLCYNGIYPAWQLLMLPAFVALAMLSAFSLGLWLAAINVRYRDVAHIMPPFLQIWFYLTPVIYPSTLVPAKIRAFYMLNPMAVAVEGCRWILFGSSPPPLLPSVVSVGAICLILPSGLYYFRSSEATFADLV